MISRTVHPHTIASSQSADGLRGVMGGEVMSMAEFSARVPYQAIPDIKFEGELRLYVEHGLRPSGFLYALLSNNISAAKALAPSQSVDSWLDWQENLPEVLQGSSFAVEQWIQWHANPASYTPLPYTVALPFSAMASARLAA